MLVAILFLILIIVSIVIFIPPFHWLIILSLINLISLKIYFVLKLITQSKKYSILTSLLIFIILFLLALNLLDPVNFILTISLFLGIIILLK